MADFFKRHPLSVIMGWLASALAVLVVLQTSGVLTGKALEWVGLAVGVLQAILTAYARLHVTPVADPKDGQGRTLVPLRNGGPVR